MKGSYQKANTPGKSKHKQQNKTKTKLFKPFWTPHEGIISKNNKHMGTTNKQTITNNKNNDFQTSPAQGPPEPD